MRRIPASCVLTERPLFEVIEAYDNSHALAGTPRKVGPPLPEARRVTLVCLSGSLMQVSLHEDVVPELPNRLDEIHKKIVDAFMWDRANRRVKNLAPLNETQSAQELQMILQIQRNVPLGVLCVEKWTDLVKVKQNG